MSVSLCSSHVVCCRRGVWSNTARWHRLRCLYSVLHHQDIHWHTQSTRWYSRQRNGRSQRHRRQPRRSSTVRRRLLMYMASISWRPVVNVKWLTTESSADRFDVNTLSVTSRGLLVTSSDYPELREYSTTDKHLLRVVKMPGYVQLLYHGVETTRGTFVIGHWGTSQDEGQRAVSELCTCVVVII